jgi:protein-disulfide isomerase
VRGTPAFFVNGDPVAKAWDLDELQAAVERALAAAAEST